jgi:hypothetical protein
LDGLVDIRVCPAASLGQQHSRIELSSPQKDAISRAILASGQVGEAALNAAVAGSSLVQMTLRAPLAASVANGTAEMMSAGRGGFYGAVVGPSGIEGQAFFTSATGLQAVAGVAAVWQITAMITAQKHMVDINKRLTNIQRCVDTLENMLVNWKLGALLGHLTYLHETHQFLRLGDWHKEELRLRTAKLEDIELQARQIMYATERDAQRFLHQFSDASHGRGFDDEKLTLKSLVQEFEFNIREILLAAQVRILTAQIRSALPLCHSSTAMRLDRLRTDLARLDSLRQNTEEGAKQKIEELGRWYKLASTEEEARVELRERLSRSSEDIQTQNIELQEALDMLSVGAVPGETTVYIELNANREPQRILMANDVRRVASAAT